MEVFIVSNKWQLKTGGIIESAFDIRKRIGSFIDNGNVNIIKYKVNLFLFLSK